MDERRHVLFLLQARLKRRKRRFEITRGLGQLKEYDATAAVTQVSAELHGVAKFLLAL